MLQELLQGSMHNSLAFQQLHSVVAALNTYRETVMTKTIAVINPALPDTPATAVVLNHQGKMDKLLLGYGAAALVKRWETPPMAIMDFEELEDGEEYVLNGPLVGIAAGLVNTEQCRDNAARAAEEEAAFGRALLADWKAVRTFARLAPGLRVLKEGGRAVAEAAVVLQLVADDPSEDEYVLGMRGVQSSVAGMPDVDALLGLRKKYEEHSDFKGRRLHLAFLLPVHVPAEHASSALRRRCKELGVHLYQPSGGSVSRVEL